jgi:hypothetical protein
VLGEQPGGASGGEMLECVATQDMSEPEILKECATRMYGAALRGKRRRPRDERRCPEQLERQFAWRARRAPCFPVAVLGPKESHYASCVLVARLAALCQVLQHKVPVYKQASV